MPPKAPPDTPTRDEFQALDAARAKLDGDVSMLRSSLELNSSEVGSLKTDVSSLHLKFDQLLARLERPAAAKTEPASTATLASSTTGPSIASSTFDTTSTPPSPVTPKWNSAEAAFPGGMTPPPVPAGKNIRIQLPSTEEPGRSFNVKPEELGYFYGVPEDTALFLSNIEAMRVSETDSGELRMQETYWRAEYGRPLSRPANASSAAGVPAYDSLVAPLPAPAASAFIAQADGRSGSPSADAHPQAARPNTASSDPRRGRSIRSDFTPANLAIRMHPELKRMMMAYKIPDTTRLMWCVRPCDHCRGDHFGFAHEHCSKNTVPTVLAIDADEDYPCTEDTGF
ncbi:unnamed protein product [Tilletia controversa]|nr:unnamed protein product [Tilletia controversa]